MFECSTKVKHTYKRTTSLIQYGISSHFPLEDNRSLHGFPPFFFAAKPLFVSIRVRAMNVNKWRQSHHILLCYRFIHPFIHNCFEIFRFSIFAYFTNFTLTTQRMYQQRMF